jgi:WD40 repeat protein
MTNTTPNPWSSGQPDYNLYAEFIGQKRKRKAKTPRPMCLNLGCAGMAGLLMGVILAATLFLGFGQGWRISAVTKIPTAFTTPALPTHIPTDTPAPTLTPSPFPTEVQIFPTPTLTITPTPILRDTSPRPTPVPIDKAVIALVWTPDAAQVVAATRQEVWIFDAVNPDFPPNRLELDVVDSLLTTIALSPDGHWLATSRENGVIEIWDMESLALSGLWQAHEPLQTIYDLAFSPDGETLATSHETGLIRFWGVPSGEVLSGELVPQPLAVRLAWHPHGQTLAVGLVNTHVQLWDWASQQALISLDTGHVGLIVALEYSPDGQKIASQSESAGIFINDTQTGERLYTLPGANALSFSPDGVQLATGGIDGQVNLWDYINNRLIRSFAHGASITSLAYSPNGSLIAVGGQDERISVWQVNSGALSIEWMIP